jgi:4-amino-4-deoxy-L-arabinose transferase-like glycosyltransferase
MERAGPRSRVVAITLAAILALAFALRVAWRLHAGEADFWRNGYTFFYDMAERLARGGGFWTSTDGGGWAVRQPVYPAFLALTVLAGRNFLLTVGLQALFGVVTALCGFLIGRRFFGPPAGLIAAALAAVYPYYVVHDTAIQDTAIMTMGAALTTLALLEARAGASPWIWLTAGALAGLLVLTRGTLLPFVLGAVAWIALAGEGPARRRLLRAGLVGVACAAVLGAWMARNYERTGHPVLSSEAGAEFWYANGPLTFSHYPNPGGIDASAAAQRLTLTPADRQALAAMPNEVDRSNWFLARGLTYASAHPAAIALGVARKELAGFAVVLNPARDPITEALYTLSYAPILLLGLLGMATARPDWRQHSLIWLQFVGFIVVTAIFWAHTSHRVYLDVYLMVFAAPVIERGWRWARTTLAKRAAAAPPGSPAAA